MKVIDAIVNDGEISSVIDIVSDVQAPRETKERIKEEVGQFLLEQTLLSVGNAESPLTGRPFKKLNKEYQEEKQEQGGTPSPNLELTGAMLNALDYEITSKGIKIGVFGSEAPKADGHNNFSGESELPQRRFLPEVGQKYKGSIMSSIDEIINDILAEEAEVSKDDFQNIETKSELFSVLTDLLGIEARSDIVRTVLGNQKLRDILDELDLLDLLSA